MLGGQYIRKLKTELTDIVEANAPQHNFLYASNVVIR